MADQTQNYAFSLPEVDGSEDLWGDLLNQNWSDLDALLKAREDGADTLTGRVTTAEGGIDDLDGRVTTAEGDLNSLTGRVTTAEGGIDGLDGRVTTAEGDIDDLEGRVSSAAKLSGGAYANFTAMPQVGGDPIVESGSNSDGEWTRWADGTQHTQGSVTGVGATVQSGNFFVSGTGSNGRVDWLYPAVFMQEPFVFAETPETSGVIGQIRRKYLDRAEAAIAAGSSVEDSNRVDLQAIGRWK